VHARDVASITTKKYGRVGVGDLVAAARRCTSETSNSMGLYYVMRVTEETNKRIPDRITLTLGIQVANGDLVEMLETKLEKVYGVIHNPVESMGFLANMKPHINRGCARRCFQL